MLQRTQVLLNHKIKQDLLALSQLRNQSVSSLMRHVLAKKLRIEKRSSRRKIDGVAIMLQMAESTKRLHLKGPRDFSSSHDYYLYGLPSLQKKS